MLPKRFLLCNGRRAPSDRAQSVMGPKPRPSVFLQPRLTKHCVFKEATMNILVCISQVPDTATKVAVGPDGKSINPQGVKFILNPYDEFAIEEALRVREAHGGTVTTLTVGGDSAKEVLRTALAMGSDSAILVKDDVRADSFVVAASIAEAAREIAPDAILFGRQSIDFDSFQVPSMVAELLDLPNVSMVSKLTIDGTSANCERDVEGGKEIVSVSLPCVFSAQKGLNDPRYPKLPDIMKAKQKPITERSAAAVSPRVVVHSMELPSQNRLGVVVGDTDADLQEIVRRLHEEAKMI
ncbi:MAG: electron transfer flavoprotein subunit beta/FixA family protein [Candidatus Kapabacteria bacterium]|nr:electron transfer flavoprotein subunit beta/FixA family protein [Candidatus Kapabacteria bacterium]